MERKQTKLYRLIDLRSGRVWDTNSAKVVTDQMFVLTMWPPHAAVYKRGRRVKTPLVGEIQELARALEAF